MLSRSSRTTPRLAALRSLRARTIWGATEPEADPLTIPLEVNSPAPLFSGTTTTKVTTLANGMKVASSDLVAPCTTVGIYVDGGSAMETVSGTAHMLQHLAFKSTAGRSAVGMVRDCESAGAVATATASRENIVYQVDTLKESVPTVLEMLAETTLAPKLLPWEVTEQKTAISYELEEFNSNHQALVQELIHPAAFGKSSPLGKPLMCPPKNLAALSPEVISAYVTQQMTPDKMVLTAAGYDHDELVAKATEIFGSLPAGTPTPAAPSPYEGGETRLSSEDDLTHFALAFKGCSWKDSTLVPTCVLNTMMGGGASFSAGGPGKGMYTRLYQNILNRYGYVQSASVFNAFYNDTGLFGVYGAAPAEGMGELTSVICDEMKKMSGAISDVELSRAKNQLKSSLLMNLESRAILFEDIGRQVLTYGARTAPEELVAQIEAVTAADLNAVAAEMLKTPPSIVVYGDTTSVPRYDVIARQF